MHREGGHEPETAYLLLRALVAHIKELTHEIQELRHDIKKLIALHKPVPVGLSLGAPTITIHEGVQPMNFSFTLTDNESAVFPFVETDKAGLPIGTLDPATVFEATAADPSIFAVSISNGSLVVDQAVPVKLGQTALTIKATLPDSTVLTGSGGLTNIASAPAGLSLGNPTITEKS